MRYKAIDFSYDIFDPEDVHAGEEVDFVGTQSVILKGPPGRLIDRRNVIRSTPGSGWGSYNLQHHCQYLQYVQLGDTPFYNYVASDGQDYLAISRYFTKVVDETDPLFNIDIIYNCISDSILGDAGDILKLGTDIQETLRDLIITREQYNSLKANADSDDFANIKATDR